MEACSQGDILSELLHLLKLEKIEENVFLGQSQDLGFGFVFGGQVLGQALSAASQTVDQERRTHSLHAYFIRPGDAAKSILYNVECLRDGKSFTTRRVSAIQNGRAILVMPASFQIAESGFDHQAAAPAVTGPEQLISEHELRMKFADKIPSRMRDKYLCKTPIEIRPIDPINPFEPKKKKPVRYSWLKTIKPMPDAYPVHQHMLAYASDFGIVGTALYPHGHSVFESKMQVASLDHAMWFHREFRMDEWLLYEMQSPNASGARGLNIGKIYTRSGKLVASVVQEGLIRHYG